MKAELPDRIVKCSSEQCIDLNKKYIDASTEDKIFINELVKNIRKNINASAEDIAAMLSIARSTLFYRLQQLQIKFNEIRRAILTEAEEELKRKITRREAKHLPARDFSEFIDREIVKKLRDRMVSAGRKPEYIQKVIRFYYHLCRYLAISPEDVVEMDREKLFDMITNYISDAVARQIAVSNIISIIQTLSKWLGVKLLPPGVTQKEYKGKYQNAEIPLDVRNKIVRELIDLYYKTKDRRYIKAIQAMAFLYYTGSRRQSLTNFMRSDVVTFNNELLRHIFDTDTFRIVVTREKRDLVWEKLIPIHYDDVIPPAPLSPTEVIQISRIIMDALLRHIDEVNEQTKTYIKLNKMFHIWRHTSTRDYLRAFQYNRYLVAKMLGWVKDSNLVIYGDYSLRELLGFSQRTKIKFIDEDLLNELKTSVKKLGL